MMPLGRLAVISCFPRQRMAQLLSFISIPGLTGPMLGPVLGGLIMEYWSWPWIFLINLPIGALGLALAWRHMPELKRAAPVPFDWTGFLIFGLAVIMFSMSMEGVDGLGMSWRWTALLLGAGFVLSFFFWFYAWRKEHPLFHPGLFRVNSFAVGLSGTLVARLSIRGEYFTTPLLLHLVLHYSPSAVGLLLTIQTMMSLLGNPVVAHFIRLLGFRRLLVGLNILSGLALISMAFITAGTPWIIVLLQLSLLGLLNGMQFVVMSTVTLMGLDESQTAHGNSLMAAANRVSASLAVGVAALLLSVFRAAPVAAAPGYGFPSTYLCIGLLSILSGFIFTRLKDEIIPAKYSHASEAA
jgi:MFS family permease